jgi:hypothetical protein
MIRDAAAMIWTWIRYVLILASAAALVLVLYAIHEQIQDFGHLDFDDWRDWVAIMIPPALVLNLVYLVFGVSRSTSGRFSRLVGLWLDAKEAELRKRAGK